LLLQGWIWRTKPGYIFAHKMQTYFLVISFCFLWFFYIYNTEELGVLWTIIFILKISNTLWRVDTFFKPIYYKPYSKHGSFLYQRKLYPPIILWPPPNPLCITILWSLWRNILDSLRRKIVFITCSRHYFFQKSKIFLKTS